MQILFDRRCKIWKCAITHEDSRPVLQHILVEPDGRLVAADGFKLAIIPCQIDWAEGEERKQVLIHWSLFEKAVAYASTADYDDFGGQTFTRPMPPIVVKDGKASVDLGDYSVSAPLWTAPFPGYKKLFPVVPPAAMLSQGINPRFLDGMCEALGGEGFYCTFYGPAQPIVCWPFGGDGIGLLMPMFWPKDNGEPIAALNERLKAMTGEAVKA